MTVPYLVLGLMIVLSPKIWASPAPRCALTLKKATVASESALVSAESNLEKVANETPFSPDQAILWRVQQGDVDKKAAQEALSAIQKGLPGVKSSELFGSGFNTCYRRFGSRAVDTLHNLISTLSGAHSESEAKQLLIAKYQKLFKVDAKESERRLCVLAGAGGIGTPKCRIFGESIAKNCR